MPDNLDRAIDQYEPLPAGLDDVEIRALALDSACRLITGGFYGADAETLLHDAEAMAIGTASRFVDWIATGDETPWTPHEIGGRADAAH